MNGKWIILRVPVAQLFPTQETCHTIPVVPARAEEEARLRERIRVGLVRCRMWPFDRGSLGRSFLGRVAFDAFGFFERVDAALQRVHGWCCRHCFGVRGVYMTVNMLRWTA